MSWLCPCQALARIPQKKPTKEAKEPYCTYYTQKRPTKEAKEPYITDKRELVPKPSL